MRSAAAAPSVRGRSVVKLLDTWRLTAENGAGGGIGEVGGVNWGAGRRAVGMEVILRWFAADAGSSVRRKSQNT